MTTEQINIAIAESMGWTNCRLAIKGAGGGTRYPTAHGIPPNRKYEASCPNYAADLNACHEFEKALTPSQLRRYANDHLYTVVIEADADRSCARNLALTTCATARQRCEAYLRTLGKWKEGA